MNAEMFPRVRVSTYRLDDEFEYIPRTSSLEMSLHRPCTADPDR